MTRNFSNECCLMRSTRWLVSGKWVKLTKLIFFDLKEQIKLQRNRLFGRKTEQTVEPNTPQLALFNEPESEPMPLVGDADEEGVAPAPRHGKRKKC